MEAPKLLRTNHAVRSAAFAYCFLMLGVHLWPQTPGAATWSLLALQFLAYPQLLHWRALRSAQPKQAELDNQLIDAALLGIWAAVLGFPTWITYALIGGTLLGAAVNRGGRGVALAALCSAAGAGLWCAFGGLRYAPATSDWVSALCALGTLGHASAVGCVVYRRDRRLAAVHSALGASEERYRLIAESAADLIALIDHDSRWLYTGPSYRQVLRAEDLALGADAWARAHPDDAEQARVSVLRAAATGKPRELRLRLVDRDGRIRQYKARLQPVGRSDPPRMLLLVSQDLTAVGEREERLLLAAHALEGMAEAIMITAADGTVVTVNHRFSEITGYSRDEVLGQAEEAIRNALQPPEFYAELQAIVQREGHWSGTTWSRRKNGSVYREWRSVRAVREPGGAVTHLVSVFYEVNAARSGDPAGTVAATIPPA